MAVDNLIPLLYSPTPNTKPPVNTRLTGELWTNLADNQLGLIDATQTAVPLIAIRFHSPSTAYVSGDFVIQGGKLWVAKSSVPAAAFNAMQWNQMAAISDFGVTVPGINDNRIVNGDMRIDQRNNGASGTASGYAADRWLYSSPSAKMSWQRVASTGIPYGFQYCLGLTTTTAYTPAAGEAFFFQQSLEADAIPDFQWGTASAQPVTLSFVASCTLGGTFSGSLCTYSGSRSYPFTFSLTANTWAKIVIVIPGDTGGPWVLAGNAGALSLRFDLGSGATMRGPANAWAAANYVGANGAVNIVATNAANLFVTGVKLEVGSVATPFNRQSLAKSMADCQRYYINPVYCTLSAYGLAGQGLQVRPVLPVKMRATPTVTVNLIANGNCGPGSNVVPIDNQSISIQLNPAATGMCDWDSYVGLDAELWP